MMKTPILFAKAPLFAMAPLFATATRFLTATLFATALVSGMSPGLAAQQAAAQQATAGAGPSAAASATPAGPASAPLSEKAFDYMRPVICELSGKLDSKSAKVGETVAAKTTASVRMADDTVIPKGAKLIGHVTDVAPHSSSQPDSHLTIAFDRAEWNGHSVPIHSVIQTVTQPANSFASDSADSLGGPIGGAGTHGMVGAHAGGGAMGGTANVGTTAGNLGTSASASASNAGSTAGGALQNVGQPGAANATSAVASLGVSPLTSASMGAHSTGVPGVMLAGDRTGATSGTLSAAKRNVHLDSGTQITIAVSSAASE